MEVFKRKKDKKWKQKLEKELRLQTIPRSDILIVVMLIYNEEDMQSVLMSDSFLLQIYGLKNISTSILSVLLIQGEHLYFSTERNVHLQLVICL